MFIIPSKNYKSMAEYIQSIYQQLLQYNNEDDVEMAIKILQCNKHRLLTTPIEELLPSNVKW